MDDNSTPTSTWLAFTLAFDASARHCQYLRQTGLEPADIGQLISDYLAGQPQALSDALSAQLGDQKLRKLSSTDIHRRITQALEWEQSQSFHQLLGHDHPRYPSQLLDTVDAPPLLYAKGDLDCLSCPAVAIVGSRKASRAAIDLTHDLSQRLAKRGIAIISGLASGIDAAAHEGALAVGGRTIAVAATEPESVYPKRHAGLAQGIIERRGLLLTEYPLGAATLRWHFPKRNRIISGLSLGVLVAEAGLPSGTLTTATHAINQGREVMAIPGSVHNPLARGCHALIKQGAALVESEQDVLDALAWPLLRELEQRPEPGRQNTPAPQMRLPVGEPGTALERHIHKRLGESPATIDDLMTQALCTVTQLNTALGQMEIEGLIRVGAGGRYTRCIPET